MAPENPICFHGLQIGGNALKNGRAACCFDFHAKEFLRGKGAGWERISLRSVGSYRFHQNAKEYMRLRLWRETEEDVPRQHRKPEG